MYDLLTKFNCKHITNISEIASTHKAYHHLYQCGGGGGGDGGDGGGGGGGGGGSACAFF